MKMLRFILLALALAFVGPFAGPAAAQSAPSAAQTQAARSRGPCSDPWVTIALEYVNGSATRALCDARLYNNGSWSSYGQLVTAVRCSRAGQYQCRAVRIGGTGPLAGLQALGIFSRANLVAAGGGNLVAAGGGNLVSPGGSNVLYIDGNSLIGTDGGTFSLQQTSGRPRPRVAPVMN